MFSLLLQRCSRGLKSTSSYPIICLLSSKLPMTQLTFPLTPGYKRLAKSQGQRDRARSNLFQQKRHEHRYKQVKSGDSLAQANFSADRTSPGRQHDGRIFSDSIVTQAQSASRPASAHTLSPSPQPRAFLCLISFALHLYNLLARVPH